MPAPPGDVVPVFEVGPLHEEGEVDARGEDAPLAGEDDGAAFLIVRQLIEAGAKLAGKKKSRRVL